MINRKYSIKKMETDLLIIGSEGAGCMAAIGAEDDHIAIMMITKGQWGKSGATTTGSADFSVDSRSLKNEFGFKNANSNDSKDLFMEDTVKGGKYLNNQKMVETLVDQVPQRLRSLQEWGAQFSGRVVHPSGHTYPRGVFFPGPNFVHVLKKRALAVPNLSVLENTVVLDLVIDGNMAKGVLALNMEWGQFIFIKAKAIVLSTGGGMSVYKYSTAPVELTGDGFAIAARAGASLVDMEFPMFFPGLFAWPPALRKIDVPYHLSSAGRIFGHMYNKRGERFMSKWDPERLEHSTRDIVSVAMYSEILAGYGSKHGGIYVSVKHLPDDLIDDIFEWDPGNTMKKFGFGKAFFNMKDYLPDLKRYSLEAISACHFFNGGVLIDVNCKTDVEGLFAAGEVTGGIHGANRLSGNAFADFMVFGKIAGKSASAYVHATDEFNVPLSLIEKIAEPYFALFSNSKGSNPFKAKEKLQNLAWEKLGIVRSQARIEKAIKEVLEQKESMRGEMIISTKSLIMNQELLAAIEALNLALNIEMIAEAALKRAESRGAHFLTDNRSTNYTDWTKNIQLKMMQGRVISTLVPVVESKIRAPKGIVPYGQVEAK